MNPGVQPLHYKDKHLSLASLPLTLTATTSNLFGWDAFLIGYSFLEASRCVLTPMQTCSSKDRLDKALRTLAERNNAFKATCVITESCPERSASDPESTLEDFLGQERQTWCDIRSLTFGWLKNQTCCHLTTACGYGSIDARKSVKAGCGYNATPVDFSAALHLFTHYRVRWVKFGYSGRLLSRNFRSKTIPKFLKTICLGQYF